MTKQDHNVEMKLPLKLEINKKKVCRIHIKRIIRAKRVRVQLDDYGNKIMCFLINPFGGHFFSMPLWWFVAYFFP
jgi:hypothetical protein